MVPMSFCARCGYLSYTLGRIAAPSSRIIRYTGSAYNPLDEGEALPVLLVKGLCRSVSHGSSTCEGFTNELVLKLKQE